MSINELRFAAQPKAPAFGCQSGGGNSLMFEGIKAPQPLQQDIVQFGKTKPKAGKVKFGDDEYDWDE